MNDGSICTACGTAKGRKESTATVSLKWQGRMLSFRISLDRVQPRETMGLCTQCILGILGRSFEQLSVVQAAVCTVCEPEEDPAASVGG